MPGSLVDGISSMTFDVRNNYPAPPTLPRQETGFNLESRHEGRTENTWFRGRPLGVAEYGAVRRSLSTHGDPQNTPSSSSPTLSGAAIGGIVVCALLSVLVVLLGLFVWHRQDKKREKSSPTGAKECDIEIPRRKHPVGTGPVVQHTPSLPPLPPLRIPSPSDSAMISVSPIESDSDAHGDMIFTISSPDSTDGTAIFLSRTQGEIKIDRQSGVMPSLLHLPTAAFDGDAGVWSARNSLRPLPKPQISMDDVSNYRSSILDLRNARMQVEGREQDFGPAFQSCYDVSGPSSPRGDDDDLLPPDYFQATQPFPQSMSFSAPVSPHGQLSSP